MHKILNDFINFIFPLNCAICGGRMKGKDVICNKCFEKIHFVGKKRCKICGTTIKSGNICKGCRKDLPFFDFVIGCGNYVPPLSGILRLYKYYNRPSLSERLARLLYSLYSSRGDLKKIKVVTWVPMRAVELRERGYNQSRLLAEQFASYASLKSVSLLKKVRNIPSQTKLSYKERLYNVVGAYKVDEKTIRDLNDDLNEGIILVDDVITTASTMNECAKVLKKIGISKVFGMVLAISP